MTVILPGGLGQIKGGGPAYSNFTYRGLVTAQPSGSIAGPFLPLAANRYCILGAATSFANPAPSSLTVNGVSATKILDNGTDQSNGASGLAIFVVNVGSTDNAAHNGGYDLVSNVNTQCSLWDVNMSSVVAHSSVHNYDNTTGGTTLALTGVTIPANGFAVLLGQGQAGGISSVDQGFGTHASDFQCADVKKTAAFSGTVTITLGAAGLQQTGILASWAGNGS